MNNNCLCPYHKYDDDVSEFCIECDVTCEVCDKNECTECRYNRIKDVTPS